MVILSRISESPWPRSNSTSPVPMSPPAAHAAAGPDNPNARKSRVSIPSSKSVIRWVPPADSAALAAAIDRYEPALVVLAGFMRILSSGFVAHYAGRLVNIHPSLLPAFTGLHTHQRAIDAGCRFAGCTVHQVTAELDLGPIVDQAVVPVLPGDTADSLAARVLTQEHVIYPRAIASVLSNM